MDTGASPSTHETRGTRTRVTVRAGSLDLALWHDGVVPDEHGGFRHRYAYRIADATRPRTSPHIGRDIHSGVGDPVDTTAGMGDLVSFLTAAADAHQYHTNHPGSDPENRDLFPAWVTEAAGQWSGELRLLALELERPPHGVHTDRTEPPTTPTTGTRSAATTGQVPDGLGWPPGRYYTVTTLPGQAGHAVASLVDRYGTGAAIERLARGDRGAATLDAALFNDEVYDQVPTRPGSLVAGYGPYVLTYHPDSGNVHLLRELSTDLQAPPGWPHRYTGIPTPTTEPPAPPPRTAHADRPARLPTPPRAGFDDGPAL